MREFSADDLGKRTDDVLAAAAQEPVAVSRNDKSGFVILTRETYDRMRHAGDRRIAGRTMAIPAEAGALLESGLVRIVESED